MGTRVHRNTSSEPLTTFLRWTMRSRQGILFNFGSFLPKFGCYGNSLGSLEILDNNNNNNNNNNDIYNAHFSKHIWYRRPRKPYCIREICVDILYRKEVMPVWMFGVSLPSLPLPVQAIFSFLRKIIEIVK